MSLSQNIPYYKISYPLLLCNKNINFSKNIYTSLKVYPPTSKYLLVEISVLVMGIVVEGVLVCLKGVIVVEGSWLWKRVICRERVIL